MFNFYIPQRVTTKYDMSELPFKVYDPRLEAKAMLQGYDAMTVVESLLSQLHSCRQTNSISKELFKERLKAAFDAGVSFESEWTEGDPGFEEWYKQEYESS